jgi:hypothetical protein
MGWENVLGVKHIPKYDEKYMEMNPNTPRGFQLWLESESFKCLKSLGQGFRVQNLFDLNFFKTIGKFLK